MISNHSVCLFRNDTKKLFSSVTLGLCNTLYGFWCLDDKPSSGFLKLGPHDCGFCLDSFSICYASSELNYRV